MYGFPEETEIHWLYAHSYISDAARSAGIPTGNLGEFQVLWLDTFFSYYNCLFLFGKLKLPNLKYQFT